MARDTNSANGGENKKGSRKASKGKGAASRDAARTESTAAVSATESFSEASEATLTPPETIRIDLSRFATAAATAPPTAPSPVSQTEPTVSESPSPSSNTPATDDLDDAFPVTEIAESIQQFIESYESGTPMAGPGAKPATKPLTTKPPKAQAKEQTVPPVGAAPGPGSPDATQPPATVPASPPPPAPMLQQPPILFEVAWEVCWQLGGIYTVLRSKAVSMMQRWGDRYFLIGPYNPNTAAVEFEEQPTQGIIRQTLDKLREAGIPCHYGRWLIAGRPRVILLDYRARYRSLDADKFLMWQDHGISTLANDGEVNEVIAFGFTVAEFFRQLATFTTGTPIVAHFHEWMAGVAVPRIAHERLPVSTVFTTHATLLGRYIAGDNPYFYQHLPFLDAEAEARKYNIYPRHQIEKAAAHASTVFTTVSEVTATEATQLLGRKPDAILPNGLNIQRFAALHEFQNLHREYKERIHEFVMGHFFPSYTFDLDTTLYLFTSGRYEYRNKGMDLFIEAMARLNQRLKGDKDRPTIVAFIITRAATRNINVGVLQNQQMFDDLRKTCSDIEHNMGRRLFLAAATGRMPSAGELMGEDSQVRLKRAMHAWRTHRQPLVVTHDLVDDANDPVLKHIRHRGLFNSADDPVKLVFHPEFVSATSPLISLDYDNFVRGCHMGIFPSYYEPWGYTPMESIALGLPAVTSDLSGFGAYVQRHIPDYANQGIYVVNRRTQSFDQAMDELVEHIYQFVKLGRRQRIELRNRVERIGELFDWSALVNYYNDAHDLALFRGVGYRMGKLDVKVV